MPTSHYVSSASLHLTRASLRWVNYKDRKRVASRLRLIYSASTEQAARDALDSWTDSEIGRKYAAINANACRLLSLPFSGATVLA